MQAKKCSSEIFFIRLRQAFDYSGLPQQELARLAGLTQSSISRYLRCATEPSVGDAAKLAVALGRPLDWFFQQDEGTKVSGGALELKDAPGEWQSGQVIVDRLEFEAALRDLREACARLEKLLKKRRQRA